MKPRIPFIFADGETLSTRKLKDNFARLQKDLYFASDRSTNTSQIVVDFTGITGATAQAARTYRFKANVPLYVVGTELIVHGDGVNSPTVAVASTSNAFNTHFVVVNSADGAGQRYYSYQPQRVSCALLSDTDFIISTGAATQAIKLVIHVQQVRFRRREFNSEFNPQLDSSIHLSQAATNLNSSLSSWSSAVSTNNSTDTDCNYEVYRIFNDAASPLAAAIRLAPCEGRTVDQVNISVVCAAGTTLNAQLTAGAGAGATITSVAVAAGGATTLSSNFAPTNATEVGTDLSVSGDDMEIEIFRSLGAGTIVAAYVTICWK